MNYGPEVTSQYRAILDKKLAAGAASATNLIETIHRDVPRDQIVKAQALRFEDTKDERGGMLVHVGTEGVLDATKFSLAQAAGRGGAPAAYVEELAHGADWQRVLGARIMNEHFAHTSGRVLVRSVRGQMRGFLSDRYRRLDSRPLVEALAGEAQAVGAIPIDGTVTETRVALKVVLPTLIEPIPGEVMAIGVEWSNSDFGNGTHGIRSFGIRVVCLNGMTNENLLKQVHLGGRLPEQIEFSDRTHQLDTDASVSALRDIVRETLGPAGIERMIGSVRAAAGTHMTSRQLAANVRTLPKKDATAIVDAFESQDVINLPEGNTAWRASNAISWIARHTEDVEKRLDMERLAGTFV